MSDKNKNGAQVGDLIMYTSRFGGFKFGKIISFNRNGTPMVQPIAQPYFKEFEYVIDKDNWTPTKYGRFNKEKGETGYFGYKNVKVDKQIPLRFGRGHEAGSDWMVIAYGENTEMARTIEEEHPIAKAKRQFRELEAGGYPTPF